MHIREKERSEYCLLVRLFASFYPVSVRDTLDHADARQSSRRLVFYICLAYLRLLRTNTSGQIKRIRDAFIEARIYARDMWNNMKKPRVSLADASGARCDISAEMCILPFCERDIL
jgi:hypothetical protein